MAVKIITSFWVTDVAVRTHVVVVSEVCWSRLALVVLSEAKQFQPFGAAMDSGIVTVEAALPAVQVNWPDT